MNVVGPSIFTLFFCGIGVLTLACSIFWVWMIIECATREPANSNDKLVWLLIIIFTHFIGAVLYFFIRRPERIRLMGR